MMFSKLLIAILISVSGFAAHAQISKSDMLSKIDKDQISFQRAPLFMIPAQYTKQMLDRTKARFPNFKESMWYYHYVVQNGYWNIVFYDWSASECLYFNFKQDSLQSKNQDLIDFVNNPGKGNKSAKREKIAVKYCEKLYNFYADKKE